MYLCLLSIYSLICSLAQVCIYLLDNILPSVLMNILFVTGNLCTSLLICLYIRFVYSIGEQIICLLQSL